MIEEWGSTLERDEAHPPRWRPPEAGWLRAVLDTCAALLRLPRNLRSLDHLCREMEATDAVRRFARAARILDNQQQAQRRLLDDVDTLVRSHNALVQNIQARIAPLERETQRRLDAS